jgi:hypothetical protein
VSADQPLCGPHNKAAQAAADAVYFRRKHKHDGGPFYACSVCQQVRDHPNHDVEEVPASD